MRNREGGKRKGRGRDKETERRGGTGRNKVEREEWRCILDDIIA